MLLLIEQFNERNLRKQLSENILNFYYRIIHISIVLFVSNISFQNFRRLAFLLKFARHLKRWIYFQNIFNYLVLNIGELLFTLGKSLPLKLVRGFTIVRAQRAPKLFESTIPPSTVHDKCYRGDGSILLGHEVLTIESKHLSTLQTYPKLYEAGANGREISTASKARLLCSRSL